MSEVIDMTTQKMVTKPTKKGRTVKEAKASYMAVPTHTTNSPSPMLIASQIAELPVEAQALTAEFVLMLRRRYAETSLVVTPKLQDAPVIKKQPRKRKFASEGMWADRTDITDSGAYSLELRRRIENREDGKLSD